jgi:hypothetical protein
LSGTLCLIDLSAGVVTGGGGGGDTIRGFPIPADVSASASFNLFPETSRGSCSTSTRTTLLYQSSSSQQPREEAIEGEDNSSRSRQKRGKTPRTRFASPSGYRLIVNATFHRTRRNQKLQRNPSAHHLRLTFLPLQNRTSRQHGTPIYFQIAPQHFHHVPIPFYTLSPRFGASRHRVSRTGRCGCAGELQPG